MVARRVRRAKEEGLCPETGIEGLDGRPPAASARAVPVKAVHHEPAEIVSALNNAVSGINAVFQMRDSLRGKI